MPGHKGSAFVGPEAFDITEIEGADVLYKAGGIIAESQRNAARLFETRKTLYSTEGSSLCIRAMLRLALGAGSGGGARPWVLAARNAHKAFLSACALLDLDVEWIYTDEGILSCSFSADDVEGKITSRDEKPIAVFVTSPDYLGNICDIKSIARVCHKHNVLLLVDNAHGAYLKFLPMDTHPITMGADICCDSAHKTLPVLTGGAYLHISKNAPACLCDGAEQAMELFASTSPSYLILQSLDRANAYLDEDYKDKLALLADRMEGIKRRLSENGICTVGNEPIKLTLAPKSFGYTGQALAEYLMERGIVCEFADPDYCVMMITPEINEDDISRLEHALLKLEARLPITSAAPSLHNAERVMSIREAMLSDSREIDVCDALGEVLASPSVSCPPAVSVLVCGERINASAIKCFEYYGIKQCRVVK